MNTNRNYTNNQTNPTMCVRVSSGMPRKRSVRVGAGGACCRFTVVQCTIINKVNRYVEECRKRGRGL